MELEERESTGQHTNMIREDDTKPSSQPIQPLPRSSPSVSGSDFPDKNNIRDSGNKSEESETTRIGQKIDDEIGDPIPAPNGEESDASLLVAITGIAITLITSQFHLALAILTFPIRLPYYLYMLVFDPFALWLNWKYFVFQKSKTFLNLLCRYALRSSYQWLKDQKAVWKVGLKCGWGLIWLAYVSTIALGILISAFVISGMLTRMLVVEPFRINQSLNFDYAYTSPVAVVPLTVEPELNHDVLYIGRDKPEVAKGSDVRPVPRDHGLNVVIWLTLPDSDYNQHLGIFQVRLEFVSKDGKTLATSKRPMMPQFRSVPVRLLLTLFKLAPILSGYASETQTLSASFRGYKERDIPTAYLRVVIEQRAEFLPGAGIPEIYDAYLTLESQLPLFLHIMWFLKTVMFLWISTFMFVTEVCFALLFCRPLVFPKMPLQEGNARNASKKLS